MTRVYDTDATCFSCQEPGQFGWLYQCTQDLDQIIEEKMPCTDFLDYNFRKSMGVRKGSAEARRDKLSFLSELTPEQMACYRPDQIATILRQREQLKNVIAREEFKRSALIGNPAPGFGAHMNDDAYTEQWKRDDKKNCQYRVCPRCRPICVDRAFLSLDAVANGEIPPTAAAGSGFEALGGRPVIKKDVIECINEHRPKANNRQMMEMLEEQIARMLGRHHKNQDLRNVLKRTVFAPQRQVRKLPIVKQIPTTGQSLHKKEQALVDVAQQDDQEVVASNPPDFLESPWPWLAAFENGNMARATEDQVQEQSSRQGLRATRIPRPTTPGSRSTRRRLADQLLFSASYFPPPEGYPWRLLSSRGNAESEAPSPRSRSQTTDSRGSGNENSLVECSLMPLAVDNGVAMTEESIETGVPDVVTQV
ncbi:hypothetical protein NW752_007188 [Fusarium irregulare]|nr:hypothetical protein NW752_007188 [Fusarium irregulare]